MFKDDDVPERGKDRKEGRGGGYRDENKVEEKKIEGKSRTRRNVKGERKGEIEG